VHTLALRESSTWLALAVYLVTAVASASSRARSRRRAASAEQREREAALLAELATELLRGRRLDEELDEIASRAASVLGVAAAEIQLGEAKRPPKALRRCRSKPPGGWSARCTRPKGPIQTCRRAAVSSGPRRAACGRGRSRPPRGRGARGRKRFGAAIS